MASPTELDIFTRSLSGDRRARTELYKKYLHDSSRVCRLGGAYADLNDFLQDTFNNLLRTGHSWGKEDSLSRWVESVAVWTALLNQRQRDMSARGAKGAVRMCAEIEGEDATHGEVLSAYAPPVLGPQDSPSTRILDLLSDPERSVFRKRAIENGTWEEVAAAAGKPLNAVGAIFARATTRLARLFGSPPPMDDDLIPVFARAAVDPQKPEGRVISLQLDAAFYSTSAETQRIGLTTSYDVRIVTLWETAASADPPGDALKRHLEQCHYCTDMLRALILMQQALLAPPGAEFQLCPGAFTLSNAPDMVRDAFDQHLAQCPVCRAERTQVLDGQAPHVQEGDGESSAAGAGKKIAWALAALVVLGVVSFAGYRYFAATQPEPAKTTVVTNDQLTPTVSVEPKYRDLVQDVPLEDGRIMASVMPENRPAAKFIIDQFALGEWSQALSAASQIAAAKSQDPGLQMLYAMCLYRSRLMTDGYREMLKSEGLPPRESFRCLIMFQFSLMVGDKTVMEREAQHLSADPKYKSRVDAIMQKVHARG